MKLISHRGNLSGPIPELENKTPYIREAIRKGYQVEVDVWAENTTDDTGFTLQNFYLTHNKPTHFDFISVDWLYRHQFDLLIHCKNKEAVVWAMKNLDGEWFAHEKDRWAATSEGRMICYGEESDIIDDDRVLVMMPEHHNIKNFPKGIYGICTDFVQNYRDLV